MSKFKFLKTKFNTMWKNFPKGRIGGDCAKYDHQCAIRMSEALRKSGIPLNTYSDPVCKVGKDPHARGAQALASWLWRHRDFGRPQIFTDAREALKKLKSQQGIIFLKDCFQRENETWEKRTGDHIDLSNKGKLRGYNEDLGRKSYSSLTNNCGTFMVDVIEAGGIDLPWILDPRPNSIIDEIRADHPKLDFAPNKGLVLPQGGRNPTQSLNSIGSYQEHGNLLSSLGRLLDRHGASPLDFDGDGIPDILQRPITVRQERGVLSSLLKGKNPLSSGQLSDLLKPQNPLDKDGDGIPDYMDRNPFGKRWG